MEPSTFPNESADHKISSSRSYFWIVPCMLALLFVAGMIGYHLGKQNSVKETAMVVPTIVPTIVPTAEPTTSPDMNTWGFFSSHIFKFSFKYPGDWKVEGGPGESFEGDVKSSALILNATLSKDGYEMNFAYPNTEGGTTCFINKKEPIIIDGQEFTKLYTNSATECSGNPVTQQPDSQTTVDSIMVVKGNVTDANSGGRFNWNGKDTRLGITLPKPIPLNEIDNQENLKTLDKVMSTMKLPGDGV